MDLQDNREQVTLAREVEAALVPVGDRVTLKAGERATITQALGGSYTVVVGGNMFRIDGKDADALGKQPLAQHGKQADATATHDAVEEAAWEALRSCYDPEIPVNIVELGLIYECAVLPLEGGDGWRVQVQMTLTAPGCGMGPMLAQDVQNKLLNLEPIDEANVELVWDPPWNQGMMTEAAKLQLGLM